MRRDERLRKMSDALIPKIKGIYRTREIPVHTSSYFHFHRKGDTERGF